MSSVKANSHVPPAVESQATVVWKELLNADEDQFLMNVSFKKHR